jgi:PncC family amidohydrolase
MSEAVTQELAATLRGSGQKLAVMESCTGGLLAHVLTNVEGCGDFFLGGIVSYATEVKVLMGVPADVLKDQGVVSAETAMAMAIRGTRCFRK